MLLRFCQPHWDKLRKNIEDRNMGHLIAKTPEEARHRMIRQGQGDLSAFEPLMAANIVIIKTYAEHRGLPVKLTCPVCDCQDGDLMLEEAAEAMLEECRRRNLVN